MYFHLIGAEMIIEVEDEFIIKSWKKKEKIKILWSSWQDRHSFRLKVTEIKDLIIASNSKSMKRLTFLVYSKAESAKNHFWL